MIYRVHLNPGHFETETADFADYGRIIWRRADGGEILVETPPDIGAFGAYLEGRSQHWATVESGIWLTLDGPAVHVARGRIVETLQHVADEFGITYVEIAGERRALVALTNAENVRAMLISMGLPTWFDAKTDRPDYPSHFVFSDPFTALCALCAVHTHDGGYQ